MGLNIWMFDIAIFEEIVRCSFLLFNSVLPANSKDKNTTTTNQAPYSQIPIGKTFLFLIFETKIRIRYAMR